MGWIALAASLILTVVLATVIGYGFMAREWDDLDPYWDDDDDL